MKSNNIFIVFILCFISFSITGLSQNSTLDSLETELKNHTEEDTTRVNLLNTLSASYSSFDFKKSVKKAKEANSLAKKLNYKKGEAKSFLRLGIQHRKKSELDEAEEDVLKALKLYEEINNQDGINASYINLGNVAHYKNETDKALAYYKKVLIYSRINGDLSQEASMLNNIGGISYLKGDIEDALTLFKKSYALRVKIGEEEKDLGALNNMGAICLNQGRYLEALEYFNQCLYIHRESKNKREIALSTYNMSAVYYELHQYDKTLMYLEESLGLYKELEDRRQVASCLINIGAVYADLKDFSKALDYMTESLRISKEINNIEELSAGNFQLGDLRLLMGQPKLALKNYQTCLDLSSSIDNSIYMCHGHIGLANAYLSLQNYSKALHHALEGEKIAGDLELLAQQKIAFGILANVYNKTGNYKKAFESHQQYKLLNDSLFNKENIEQIAQLENEYKYKQELDSAKFRELSLAQEVIVSNNDLEKSQQNLLLGVVIFLLVILILGGIIFYLKFRNIKSKTQNIEIEQKLLRSQMTPHFIFNSLSVLQGMILNKEEKKSVLYLSKFSKLLRIILENSRFKTVSLDQELIAIDNYLALQNLENEAYQYTITVDDAIIQTSIKIPPMLIQPFVENAIEHAFTNQIDNKKIDIHIVYSNESLICTITDNGVGVNAKKENKRKDKNSLSTSITSERLKILSKNYKIKGSVTIEDRQKNNEQGTIVTLVIPYKSK
jgi:tetratricopeptide (TPR) repeat protein